MFKKKIVDNIQRVEEQYKNILDFSFDGVYFVDTGRKITYWNKGAERITGFSKDEVVNSFCYNNLLQHIDEKGNRLCVKGCPLVKTIEAGTIMEEDIYLHHKMGYMVPIKVKSMPIYGKKGEVIGAVEVFTDNPEIKEHDIDIEKFKKDSILDEATNLPKREYLDFLLKAKLEDYRVTGRKFGLVLFDLDRFKFINDNYGEKIGDALLEIFGKTIQSNTKSKDAIGRWAEESFLGIIELEDSEQLEKIAERLRIMVKNTILNINNKKLSITVSIGGTMVNEDDTFELIINRAIELLSKSKEEGRDRVTIG